MFICINKLYIIFLYCCIPCICWNIEGLLMGKQWYICLKYISLSCRRCMSTRDLQSHKVGILAMDWPNFLLIPTAGTTTCWMAYSGTKGRTRPKCFRLDRVSWAVFWSYQTVCSRLIDLFWKFLNICRYWNFYVFGNITTFWILLIYLDFFEILWPFWLLEIFYILVLYAQRQGKWKRSDKWSVSYF